MSWLEDENYLCDLFSDVDFHIGKFDPANYAGLILLTHPEYWSSTMRDRLDSYLAAGGKLIYLGGNGLFERVEYTEDLRVMLLRVVDVENRWLFRTQGRPEREVLGICYNPNAFGQTVTGYRTRLPEHRFFNGTNLKMDAAFGDTGLSGTSGTAVNGCACGWEMDSTFDDGTGGILPALQILAESELPASQMVSAESEPPGSQMVSYDTKDGFVFSVGSLTFGGSLAIDPIVQQIVRNVLNECLSRKKRSFNLPLLLSLIREIIQGVLGISPTGKIVPIPPRSP